MILKLLHIIFITVMCSTALLSNNLSWVDQQIAAIIPKRVGISDSKISEISSPIRYQKRAVENLDPDTKSAAITNTQITEPVKPLKLTAIMNNSALIDGKWLKVNDTVRGYKIGNISNDHVLLRNKEQKLKLFIKEKNDKIKIQIN